MLSVQSPLREKTIQNYSENHYLKLFLTIVTIEQSKLADYWRKY